MDKLNSLKVVITATGVSGNEYEVQTEYKLKDMDVSLTILQSGVFSSVASLMDDIDDLRELMGKEAKADE